MSKLMKLSHEKRTKKPTNKSNMKRKKKSLNEIFSRIIRKGK